MRTACHQEAYTELPACPEPVLWKALLEFYLNQWDWGFPHLFGAVQLWPVRAALFWPIRTVLFGPIKLQRFGVLICMRLDHLGTKDRNFCLYNPVPLLLWECTFLQKTKDCVSLAELKHQRCLTKAEWSRPVQARADWHRVEQTKAQQSRPVQHKADRQGAEQSWRAREYPGPRVSQLYHNWAVLHWIKFPSSQNSKLGIPTGVELVGANNHQLTNISHVFFSKTL